jgi:hypothetical protein
MPLTPNSTRSLLEQIYGRRVETQAFEKAVTVATGTTPIQLLPANPKRVAFSVGMSFGSYFAIAQSPDLLAAGGGVFITLFYPINFSFTDLLDDVTNAWWAAQGTPTTVYVREITLIGTL